MKSSWFVVKCLEVSPQHHVVFCTRQGYLIILPCTWGFDSSSTSSTITSGRGLWITSEPHQLQNTKKSILPPIFFYEKQVIHLWCKASTPHEAKGKGWVENSVNFMQMHAVSIHLAKGDNISSQKSVWKLSIFPSHINLSLIMDVLYTHATCRSRLILRSKQCSG